jgi:hypothetical protein
VRQKQHLAGWKPALRKNPPFEITKGGAPVLDLEARSWRLGSLTLRCAKMTEIVLRPLCRAECCREPLQAFPGGVGGAQQRAFFIEDHVDGHVGEKVAHFFFVADGGGKSAVL